jgi:hypothetical protein
MSNEVAFSLPIIIAILCVLSVHGHKYYKKYKENKSLREYNARYLEVYKKVKKLLKSDDWVRQGAYDYTIKSKTTGIMIFETRNRVEISLGVDSSNRIIPRLGEGKAIRKLFNAQLKRLESNRQVTYDEGNIEKFHQALEPFEEEELKKIDIEPSIMTDIV